MKTADPTRRALTILLALALLGVAGCGGTGNAKYNFGPDPGVSSSVSPGAGGGGASPRASVPNRRGVNDAAAGPGAAPARPVPAGGGGPGNGRINPPGGGNGAINPDDGGLGSMSRAFLRPAPYTAISFEEASASGAAPSPAVSDNLATMFGQYSGKPVGRASHTFSGKGSGCWTDQDIASITAAQRQVHTGGHTAAFFMGFLDGSYCPNQNVLGLAYGASAVVIFTAQVQNLALNPTKVDQYMEAVTVHEAGHVLGMVNIGYQSRVDHEDASHPHHSSNQGSVMYYAIDQSNLYQQFLQGPPTTFDSNDKADLAGLANGSL